METPGFTCLMQTQAQESCIGTHLQAAPFPQEQYPTYAHPLIPFCLQELMHILTLGALETRSWLATTISSSFWACGIAELPLPAESEVRKVRTLRDQEEECGMNASLSS